MTLKQLQTHHRIEYLKAVIAKQLEEGVTFHDARDAEVSHMLQAAFDAGWKARRLATNAMSKMK